MNGTERLTAYTRGYSAEELYAKGYADGYENGRMSKEPVFFLPCEDCNKKMDEVRRAYDKVQAGINNTVEELEILRKRAEILMWYDRFDKKQCLDLINGRIKELKGE